MNAHCSRNNQTLRRPSRGEHGVSGPGDEDRRQMMESRIQPTGTVNIASSGLFDVRR